MWNYAKKYLYFAIPAALFMVGEVSMDLLQPGLMRQIVDDGVLKLDASGAGGLELIVRLGLIMILLVLFGGACGALNNMFVHLTSQKDSKRLLPADHDLFLSTNGPLRNRVSGHPGHQ